MNSNNRAISLIFLLASFMIAGIFLYILFYVGNLFNIESKLANYELVFSVVGVMVLIGSIVAFNKNQKSIKFTGEVVDEFTRVTWPKKVEVRAATIVVTLFIIICGVILGIFDVAIGRLIALLLGV